SLQSLSGRGRAAHVKTLTGKDSAQDLAQNVVVINEQDHLAHTLFPGPVRLPNLELLQEAPWKQSECRRSLRAGTGTWPSHNVLKLIALSRIENLMILCPI